MHHYKSGRRLARTLHGFLGKLQHFFAHSLSEEGRKKEKRTQTFSERPPHCFSLLGGEERKEREREREKKEERERERESLLWAVSFRHSGIHYELRFLSLSPFGRSTGRKRRKCVRRRRSRRKKKKRICGSVTRVRLPLPPSHSLSHRWDRWLHAADVLDPTKSSLNKLLKISLRYTYIRIQGEPALLSRHHVPFIHCLLRSVASKRVSLTGIYLSFYPGNLLLSLFFLFIPLGREKNMIFFFSSQIFKTSSWGYFFLPLIGCHIDAFSHPKLVLRTVIVLAE